MSTGSMDNMNSVLNEANNYVEVNFKGVAMTTKDGPGYYGVKNLTLPEGTRPTSLVIMHAFSGGVSFNLLYQNTGWKVLAVSPASYTFDINTERVVRVYYTYH